MKKFLLSLAALGAPFAYSAATSVQNTYPKQFITHTPQDFIRAAAEGDLTTIEEFIQKGTDANLHAVHKNTALLLAAFHGHFSIVQLLLMHGADANAKDEQGHTALKQTIRGGIGTLNRARLQIIDILIMHGAMADDPELSSHETTETDIEPPSISDQDQDQLPLCTLQ